MDDNISLLEFQSRIGIPIIIFNLGTAKYVQGYYITKNSPPPPDTRGGRVTIEDSQMFTVKILFIYHILAKKILILFWRLFPNDINNIYVIKIKNLF